MRSCFKYKAVTLDRIAELWAQGLKTSAIGADLGIPKNTICRIAHDARRAGDERFPMRGPPRLKRVLEPELKSETPALKIKVSVPRRKRTRPVMPPVKRSPSLPPRDQHPRIHELRQRECRYPVSSGPARGDHRFCAKPTRRDQVYCPEHEALCNPVPPVKREARRCAGR